MDLETAYRLTGEFSLKVSAFEATLDALLFQAVTIVGRPFTDKFRRRPVDLGPKAEAFVELIDLHIQHKVPVNKSPFGSTESVLESVGKISEIRNALFHSSWCFINRGKDGPTMVLQRIERKGQRNAQVREYSTIVREFSQADIQNAIKTIEDLQILIELSLAAISLQCAGWNEQEVHRYRPIVFLHLDHPRRAKAMYAHEDPFLSEP